MRRHPHRETFISQWNSNTSRRHATVISSPPNLITVPSISEYLDPNFVCHRFFRFLLSQTGQSDISSTINSSAHLLDERWNLFSIIILEKKLDFSCNKILYGIKEKRFKKNKSLHHFESTKVYNNSKNVTNIFKETLKEFPRRSNWLRLDAINSSIYFSPSIGRWSNRYDEREIGIERW